MKTTILLALRQREQYFIATVERLKNQRGRGPGWSDELQARLVEQQNELEKARQAIAFVEGVDFGDVNRMVAGIRCRVWGQAAEELENTPGGRLGNTARAKLVETWRGRARGS